MAAISRSKRVGLCTLCWMNLMGTNRGAIEKVFPPLPSRLRFLIHKTTESQSELTTFSVGEDWGRRVVVCFSELRADVEKDGDPEVNHSRSEGEAAVTPCNRRQMDRAAAPSSRGVGGTRASKRPDRALYTPQAARERSSFSKRPPAPTRGLEPPDVSSCSAALESHLLTEAAGEAKASHVPHVELPPSTPTSPPEDLQAALPEGLKTDPLTWSFSLEQTLSNFTVMSLERDGRGEEQQQPEEEAANNEERGKEMTSDPSSTPPDMSTVTAQLTHEISSGLKEMDGVVMEQVHNDYSVFENVLINSGEFGHVIEIYGFPAVFRTDDLMDAFTSYSDGGMKITWVDNTHALAVFSSETAAQQALAIRHPLLKTRTLSQASKPSQAKASRRAEFIQPVKERPQTDSAVARRMVSRALGLHRGQVKHY